MTCHRTHPSPNPGEGTVLPMEWKRDLLKRLKQRRLTLNDSESSVRFINIPPSWLHNGELREEKFRLLDQLMCHTERGSPINIYERVEPKAGRFLYLRRSQSYCIWKVPRPDNHTLHNEALDDKTLADDEILMIHKMSQELATKIKSLDVRTLEKISSVAPKIWERLKQLPLEAFDAMLGLKAADWDEFMKRWYGERKEAASRARQPWRVTPKAGRVARKPKEHGDGPHRAPSRIPVPLTRLPQQKTRSHEEQHVIGENALDLASSNSPKNVVECAERKDVGGLRPQRRQRTTQSTRGKKESKVSVSVSTTNSNCFPSEVTRNRDPSRKSRVSVSVGEKNTTTLIGGSTGCYSSPSGSSKNCRNCSPRSPEPTDATTNSLCPAWKTSNTAVESVDCSIFSPETSAKDVGLSPRCRSPTINLKAMTPISPKRGTARAWWEGNIVVSYHVMVPIVDVSAVNPKWDENDNELVELGQGAFSTVYLADLSVQQETRLVAVKIFNRSESTPSDILREASITMVLADTGFVPRLYGYLLPDMSLVQECFGQGTTLEDLLSASQVFGQSKETWLSIANQLAQGLREFFHRGILHNDIKPENILVDWTMHGYPIKYIDFGRATCLTGYLFTEKDLRSVKRGQLAPELWFKNRTSPASDIFSLGRVLTSIAQNGGSLVEIEDVARKCVKPTPTNRPEVDIIIRDLQGLRCRLHH